jgi:hypothetical protein
MRFRYFIACLVVLGVAAVWYHTVQLRLPYMNQIPVFDADGLTGEAYMWARMWWDQNPFVMWFSTPRAPPSIEVPALASGSLYESWPSGSFVPIYVTAKLLGIEPSIPMANWINTAMQGLVALAIAFIAFNVALLNRLGSLSSGVIAVAATFAILLSSGLIYIFSQIYEVVICVLIYVAAFILLEVLFYRAQSGREKRIITRIQLVVIFAAFLVDWLSYTLFVFWLVSRVVAGYLGFEERLTLRRLAGLLLVPGTGFSLYLVWRFFAPGSTGRTSGISASISDLANKILERMNLTEESHITGFWSAFMEMHDGYFAPNAFSLIVWCALISAVMLVLALRLARDDIERRSIFGTLSILFLVTVPFYFHMLIIYQHTYIHRWAITKAMFAFALVPIAFLPISIFTLVRQILEKVEFPFRRLALSATGLVLALVAFGYAETSFDEPFRFYGRINRDNMLMWDDIGRNTRYQDVVVSPVLEAAPITKEIGASYKLVHLVKNFSDVDKIVEHVCGDFNVVVALPEGAGPGELAAREPSQVTDTGRIRLLRYLSYRGKAAGCS